MNRKNFLISIMMIITLHFIAYYLMFLYRIIEFKLDTIVYHQLSLITILFLCYIFYWKNNDDDDFNGPAT